MDIKDLAEKYKLEHDDFWKCHNDWILKHDACTKIAQRENIKLSKIESIYQSETVCRFLITVVKEDKDGNVVDSITSVGEATHPKDCKITYVGSMAEKRGYDRGVLKLIKAYEWGIYSEVEAEDFQKEKSRYENR